MDCIQKELKIFSGSSNPELSQKIVELMGAELSPLQLETFANGEIYARYPESVRGSDVFIIQSIAGPRLNDLLMEVLVMADAARRASARTVTGVITHYAYARQDRKAAPREPITAKLIADLFKASGIDRLITIDLHQGQIQGFFDGPVNHLTGLPLFAKYYSEKGFDMDEVVVVSPDVGRAKASKRLSDMLGCNFAVAHKGRPSHNTSEVMGIIGDIEGRICIINDDMIDTAGTLCGAVRELKKKGAGDVYVSATHGLLSGPAYERLQEAPIKEICLTDAVPLDPERSKACDKIQIISVADEFARAINNVYREVSVSGLFGINPEF